MKKYIRFSGLAVMYLGVILLIVGYAFSWTDSNAFIISAVALVVLGVAWHVYLLKKESKY
ncbi:hypothetical protein [uncultured Prevotella sp.]|uniref:hypothetical protein n=1 Tax=uncultured Prevotella sp. TaxID=159272 RepID=UPI0025EF50EE|nr:hypothetical protein [uncultured Prevotella sp.]